MEHGTGVFSAIEHSALGLLVRDSLWLYPAANVLHVLSVVVFFASVAVMDLAVLRALPGAQIFTIIDRVRPFAAAALTLLVLTGSILFVAEANALVRNPAFLAKMATIAAALVNVAVFEQAARDGRETAGLRLMAGLSLGLWLLVAALGRFIAYA